MASFFPTPKEGAWWHSPGSRSHPPPAQPAWVGRLFRTRPGPRLPGDSGPALWVRQLPPHALWEPCLLLSGTPPSRLGERQPAADSPASAGVSLEDVCCNKHTKMFLQGCLTDNLWRPSSHIIFLAKVWYLCLYSRRRRFTSLIMGILILAGFAACWS